MVIVIRVSQYAMVMRPSTEAVAYLGGGELFELNWGQKDLLD